MSKKCIKEIICYNIKNNTYCSFISLSPPLSLCFSLSVFHSTRESKLGFHMAFLENRLSDKIDIVRKFHLTDK